MPHAVATCCLAVLLVLASAGCRRGAGPILDTSPGPEHARGTIAGTLQKPGNVGAVAGRGVRAIDVASGRAFQAITNPAGGFTIQVPPGTYRLEVQLLAGEQVHNPPGEISVGAGDINANIAITVGPPSPLS
jgi:hypothetical protein